MNGLNRKQSEDGDDELNCDWGLVVLNVVSSDQLMNRIVQEIGNITIKPEIATDETRQATNLNPSEDYKTSVLSGLSPNIIMECSGRGALVVLSLPLDQQRGSASREN